MKVEFRNLEVKGFLGKEGSGFNELNQSRNYYGMV
jgi:hypothetical protein